MPGVTRAKGRSVGRERFAYEEAADFALALADRTELIGRHVLGRQRLHRLRLIDQSAGSSQRSAWKLGMRGPYSPRLERGLEILEDAGAIRYEPGLVTTPLLRTLADPATTMSDAIEPWLRRRSSFLDLAATIIQIKDSQRRRGLGDREALVKAVSRYGGSRWTVSTIRRVANALEIRKLPQ